MKTSRFETFMDAIIAIVMTVLVLKIPQPPETTLKSIWSLKTLYLSYIISFITIFNIWYSNHNLFQLVDTINNFVVWSEGIIIFLVTLIPYFTMWAGKYPDSLICETTFGIIFILLNIFYNISLFAITNSNRYNPKLLNSNRISNRKKTIMPTVIVLIGFLVSYTIYKPGIYIFCLVVSLMWAIESGLSRDDVHE